MNKKVIINELQELYPGKKIICLPEENPSEILCEIDPAENHPEKSNAISVIDKSISHLHKKTTEVYKVVKGTLKVHVDDKIVVLQKGETITILPNTKHWAEGDETWIEVFATPGWVKEDHILL